MSIKFEIRYPNGQRGDVLIEGERAVIGSGAHCDVRLTMDQAAYEQLVVEAVGNTLRMEAKADQPAATMNGMTFSSGTLPPEAVIEVGGVRLMANLVFDGTQKQNSGPSSKKELSPASLLGLAVMVGALAFLSVWDGEGKLAPAPTESPSLFGAPPLACPQSDAGQARAYAEEQLEVAESKRERLAFAAKDGVEAVHLYELAAACFRQGNDGAGTREAEAMASGIKESLGREFRTRNLRLSHTLKVEDYELAVSDWRVLHELVADSSGVYAEWLDDVATALEARGFPPSDRQ